MVEQQGDGLGGVAQHLAHERVPAQQAVAHLVVVLRTSSSSGSVPLAAAPAVFKTDRIRRQHDKAFRGEGRAECLQRLACQAADLALAQVALPGMLMVNDDGRKGAGTVRDQQVSRDRVTFGARVCDPAPAIAGFGFHSVHDKIYRVADG